MKKKRNGNHKNAALRLAVHKKYDWHFIFDKLFGCDFDRFAPNADLLATICDFIAQSINQTINQ